MREKYDASPSSMDVVEPIVVLLVIFLCFVFRSPLSALLCFLSQWFFSDQVEDPYADLTYICNLHQNYRRGVA